MSALSKRLSNRAKGLKKINRRGLWDRSDTVQFLAQPKWWAPVLTEGQGHPQTATGTAHPQPGLPQGLLPTGKETAKWPFPPPLRSFHQETYAGYSSPPVPGREQETPGSALASTPAMCYNSPGEETTAAANCVQHGKAELRRRPPRHPWNTQLSKAEQQASQTPRHLCQSPRSCIEEKAQAILGGTVATVFM